LSDWSGPIGRRSFSPGSADERRRLGVNGAILLSLEADEAGRLKSHELTIEEYSE
jgi:hypothetical protein